MKVAIRKLKEEMDNLTVKNEQLNMEICSQEEQMEDKNQQVITGKRELEEITEKEMHTQDELEEKKMRMGQILSGLEKTQQQLEAERLKNEKIPNIIVDMLQYVTKITRRNIGAKYCNI